MDVPVLNCETCGGILNYSPDGLHAVCPYCGNEYYFKNRKGEALSLALNRANLLRRSCDFDGAITEYKLILSADGEDAEARWGLALSEYGIEYVEDSRTKKLIPTCRRTVRKSILEDENYLAAIKYAEPKQAESYMAEAKVIDRLQRDIKRRMDEEEDFDVFLCFRSSDDLGFPTRERSVARRIYDELEKRGIKTFFSEVTLKDRIGDDYEPIIYKALYSCKFFILIATSEENINAPWVKNEWSRFRDRQAEEGLSGACCAVFEGVPLSSLPSFLRSAQGVNLAKYPANGYEIEIADNLSRRFKESKKDPYGEKPEDLSDNMADEDMPADLRVILDRAQISLDDEIYSAAMDDYQKALKLYPKCGYAWWGYFLASQNANSAALAAQKTDYERAETLSTDRYLRNAERFGSARLRAKIASYKKMCSYRCGELADECGKKIEKLEKEIEDNNAALAEIAKKKDDIAKKRERAAKLGNDANYKKVKRMINLVFAIMIIFLVVIAAFTSDTLFIMAGLWLLMFVIMTIMLSFSRKTAKQQVDELGRQVSGYYARENALRQQNEKAESELEEEKRRQKAFKGVFG
ncbi:MAG: TIR domain-containing protein [Clostridia bacterium]|nr:TIR domain-containing protein [Clostridia bacterium]